MEANFSGSSPGTQADRDNGMGPCLICRPQLKLLSASSGDISFIVLAPSQSSVHQRKTVSLSSLVLCSNPKYCAVSQHYIISFMQSMQLPAPPLPHSSPHAENSPPRLNPPTIPSDTYIKTPENQFIDPQGCLRTAIITGCRKTSPSYV